MLPILSLRVQQIKPSATLVLSAQAIKLKEAGKDIISLTTGEPDFDTPDFVKKAAIEAIHAGFTKYTPADGTTTLKQAIINKLKRENDLAYNPDQILVSCGAKQSLYNLTQAILDPEDEAIIPTPYWVSYPSMVSLAGGKPVFLETKIENNFKITPEQLRKSITDKTKLFFINSPSNPSGQFYRASELKALGEVLSAHPQVLIATDDIYEHILWDNQFVTLLNVCPELYERTVVINGVSKGYAMTGWRIGYAAAPKEIIAGMKKIQSHSTSNATSISQAAAEAALNGGTDSIQPMCDAFKARSEFAYNTLNAIDGIKCLHPTSTFYLFPNVSAIIQKLNLPDDVVLAEYLLNEFEIAVIPGSAFGSKNYIRLSCAVDMPTLKEGLERIKRAFT